MRGLRLLYLGLGVSTAALNPFLAVILAGHGLETALIGVVIALGAAGIFGAGPIWGHLGDDVLGRRTTLLILYAIASLAALAIGSPVGSLAVAVMVIAFMLSQGNSTGLTDSIAISILPDPGRQYGRMRMLASLSFGVTSIPLGFLYSRTGYGMGSLLFVVTALAIALCLALVPDRRPPRRTAESKGGQAASLRRGSRLGSTGLAFRVQPRLPGVLTAIFLVWFTVNVSFTFLSLRIVDLGGDASYVALSFGVSALFEVPGILLASRVAARLGLRGLFALGTLGYGLAFVSWVGLDTPAAIVVSRVVTGVCYGGMIVAIVLTIGEILPEGLQATGQTLYQATAVGLASVAGNTVGGVLYGLIGAPSLFAVCAAIAAAGALVGFATLPARVRRVEVPVDLEEVVRPRSPVV